MILHPCMGGWCTQRDRCANYHSDFPREPSERLCNPGQEKPTTIVRLARVLPSQQTPADPAVPAA